MSTFAIIGSGPMGLMAALELLKQGHQVDVYERDDRIGGMSADFDFDGLRIERYYHFICKTDYPLFSLLDEMQLSDRLHWTDTKMGYFYQGKLHKWGTPFALLGFPHLGLVDKVRYALHVMHTKGIKDWAALDKENARDWITRWIGPKAYKVMWEKAFALKFFEYQNDLSASWIGTRIKRVALSRRNLLNESMGYLEGGSAVLLDRMATEVRRLGGNILLSQPIEEVTSKDGKVTGILTPETHKAYTNVISTAPIQYVPKLVPGLPRDYADKIAVIDNIPVACVILKLSHPVSENFWMNISDERINIPGLIEYSNLNPGRGPGEHIVYAPYYMPKTHPKWQWTNQQLIDEVISYLPMINPVFKPEWIRATHCHRYEYAQTICPPGFQDMLPSMQSPLAGFFMADTAYYYPEDRSINESIAVGQTLARLAAQGAAGK
ncbi:NAD(P)/FAD-dependent oxidoreductase [Xanthomonas arboricola]|uniref:NAD(P)/FAD-dependent oxidoreductase n=1 Tax=Xanthomonas arboricola TaxID=56448 RepID=UPI000E1E8205|nr:NAD(P)/FAD-dependent oxidoreductase [Xanthomonas arboricola]NIK52450.1 protoporphyrinogen oxidase [Xanthomonas arboricola]NJB94012.1 protoporphyrinogen oxidase [Xanthomonas arboricola]